MRWAMRRRATVEMPGIDELTGTGLRNAGEQPRGILTTGSDRL
jgi:hypothetical protein